MFSVDELAIIYIKGSFSIVNEPIIFELSYLKFFELLKIPIYVFPLTMLEFIDDFKLLDFSTLTLLVSITRSFYWSYICCRPLGFKIF
jgi:hypothetical protein